MVTLSFFGIILVVTTKYTEKYYSPKQGRFPVFLAESLEIGDAVLVFDGIMEEIGIERYLKPERAMPWGRPRYNRVNLLKTVLFGAMDKGAMGLRELEDLCKVNLRYMYLMDYETPSYRTFGNFIAEELTESIEEIFLAVMEYIRKEEQVDMDHLYIDGSKFEANANKNSYVWKKGTEKARYKLYEKITALLDEMNEGLQYSGVYIETNTEYSPESLEVLLQQYKGVTGLDEGKFAHGRGHRKSREQRLYEKLAGYKTRLSAYVEKLHICGPGRNSYSKTDHDATFMRMKMDYMDRGQLLPGYNVQIGVADEYIAVVEVMQYRSDMDCFIPLMEKFRKQYGFYPKYPVADAGYGSFNNYIFCENKDMEKFMKFPMYKKETEDANYREDPFRAVNFRVDSDGDLVCPNGRKLKFTHRRPVKGNLFGRQEEVYECVDCSDCPYAGSCKKTERNRTVRLNQELTAMHQEVLDNLNCIHGALLRMNRSIQAEGTFGVLKQDRGYRRIVRRGLKSVQLEIYLLSIGHNLYKFYNKQNRLREAA